MFILDVITALNSHKVNYALIGGYAVALHGAIRGTVDIDILISINKTDFRNAEKAMKSIGLESRLPVTADEVFDYREEYIRNRNLAAWTFTDPSNPLQIVDILITQDLSNIQTVNKRVGRRNIKVVAIPDLIRLKKESGRQQDIEDIRALEKLL